MALIIDYIFKNITNNKIIRNNHNNGKANIRKLVLKKRNEVEFLNILVVIIIVLSMIFFGMFIIVGVF
jgi:hypothetical protein